jgi:hypothetical protein
MQVERDHGQPHGLTVEALLTCSSSKYYRTPLLTSWQSQKHSTEDVHIHAISPSVHEHLLKHGRHKAAIKHSVVFQFEQRLAPIMTNTVFFRCGIATISSEITNPFDSYRRRFLVHGSREYWERTIGTSLFQAARTSQAEAQAGSIGDLFPGREFMPRNLNRSIHTGEYSWSMVLKNTENEPSERLCSRLQEYRKPKLHYSKSWFGK